MSIAIAVRPVRIKQTLEQSFQSFLCDPITLHSQSFHKMRCTALTTVFFALFALFSGRFHFQLQTGDFSDFRLQPWRMLPRFRLLLVKMGSAVGAGMR